MKRILCIWLPSWPIQRLVVARPALKGQVLILHARDPRRGPCVTACSRAAYHCGVRTGMPMTEAMTLFSASRAGGVAALDHGHPKKSPTLPAARQSGSSGNPPVAQVISSGKQSSHVPPHYVMPHDPAADWQGLVQLAHWCEQFSPLVGFEVTVHRSGSGSLFGGELRVPGGMLPPKNVSASFHSSAVTGHGLAKEAFRQDCLYLDITHLAAYHGGEDNLVRQVTATFDRRGYHARIAVADTLGAAWALAHFGRESARPLSPSPNDKDSHPTTAGSSYLVVARQKSFAALQPLPVRALRLPDQTAALLHQLGIFRIGQLAQLPRASLSSRLGTTLVQRWDQALGLVAEPLVMHRPAPQFRVECALEHPTNQQSLIVSILERLLQQLARSLAQRGDGVLELLGRFVYSQWEPVSLPAGSSPAEPAELPPVTRSFLPLRVGLFQPTASADHLMNLVRMQLEHLVVPGQVEHITLEATLTAPLTRQQRELFPDRVRHTPRPLAQLVDRLSNRLGGNAVVRPYLQADAQPEHACWYQPLTGRYASGGARPQRSGQTVRRRRLIRPLHLRSPPLPLDVLAVAPHGPPVRLHWQGRQHRVARCWGPERLETGWWRAPSVRRDYYRVETESGHWFWIFRKLSDGSWFLHGQFD